MNLSTPLPGSDPLGLRGLPEAKPEPGRIDQDWAAVSAALRAMKGRRRLGGLGAAASVALVLALLALTAREPAAVDRVPQTAEAPPADTAPAGSATAAPAAQPSTEELIAISQDMERQLRFLREQVSSMPSEIVMYQVELQDLIGQVDDALSLTPDSNALWSQRLDLQMDLAKLYRSQLRRDHLRLASL